MILRKSIYIYLTLPFLIFVLGWVKSVVAIPMVIAILVCLWRIFQQMDTQVWSPSWDRNTVIKVVGVILVLALWVYMSGVGKLVFQNLDHAYRNTIFRLLVEEQWPIVQSGVNGSDITMIYYIGFWMPAAIVGKIIGLEAGYYMQVIWAYVGVCLFYLLLCQYRKKIEIWPMVVFILFSGLDIVGNIGMGGRGEMYTTAFHQEWWNSTFQFTSITAQLFWVFNQAIPAWLCTMMIFTEKNNRNIVFILGSCLISSTLPAVGLILLMIYVVFTRTTYKKPWLIGLVKDTCTIQNVLGGGIMGLTTFFYLLSNTSANNVMQEITVESGWDYSVFNWCLFFAIELLCYIIVMWKFQRKNWLFYYTVVSLIAVSCVRIGLSNDFCMRASIPGLVIFIILILETLEMAYRERKLLFNRMSFIALVGLLVIGSVTPFIEFKRTIQETISRKNAGEEITDPDVPVDAIMGELGVNFSGDVTGTIYDKYLMKKNINE